MAKKNSEAKKISMQMDRDFEKIKARIAPKMLKRSRGRLKRIRRYMSRLKPLKVKEHSVMMAQHDAKSKLSQAMSNVVNARKKSRADKARVINLTRELKTLRRQIPQNKSIRTWSSAEKKLAKKTKSIGRDLGRLQKRISKEEKGKDKVVSELQKYFQ